MDRRQYLNRTAITLVGCSLLAGCLDSIVGEERGVTTSETDRSADDEETAGDGEETEGDGEETESREADRAIRQAAGSANRASLSLAAVEEELEDSDSIDFDADEPRELIDEAGDHLEAAESEPDISEEQLADVEELETLLGILYRIVNATDFVTDESLETAVDEIQASIENDDVESAQEILDELEARIVEEKSSMDDALDDLDAVDRDRLEALDVVDLDELETGATEIAVGIDSFETLASGLDSILSGYESLAIGKEDLENGRFEAAIESFEEANVAFENAGTIVDGSEAPPALSSHFEVLSCQANRLESAAQRFVDAANAAADEDPVAADQYRQEGEAYVEAAESCAD